MLIYGSVCSGIEAATVAWKPLGWEPAYFAEIEKFPSAVLQYHYPEVPNLGDITKFKSWPDESIDLLVGGTPCQSFSVAGLRKGLDDPRGNLMLTYLAISKRYRPKWILWENVPGVLSSNGGRDFGTFLGGLAECGYGFAYRIFDAQYFGLAQRRRRVFVVGYLGDWRPAAAVLFERDSLSWNPPPSRKAGQGVAADVAPSIGASGRGFERAGESRGQDPVIAMCLNSKGGSGRMDAESETLIAHSLRAEHDASEDGTGRGTPLVPVAFNGRMDPVNGDIPGAIDTDPMTQCVAFAQNSRDEVRQIGGDGQIAGALAAEAGMKQQNYIAFNYKEANSGIDITPTLDSGGGGGLGAGMGAMIDMQVRRLTPVECERLMGFPDNYSLIPYRGKPAADGPRYKALGNSMAVPVMRWIGERIEKVERILHEIQQTPLHP
jgi:DNA (cytosine-5)-methyltransferase 1